MALTLHCRALVLTFPALAQDSNRDALAPGPRSCFAIFAHFVPCPCLLHGTGTSCNAAVMDLES